MPDDDLRRRLDAVERALTDSDTAVGELSDAAAVHDRLGELEADLATLHERVDALEATVQSLHGYVGELEAVNDRVERRADAARAAVERLEDQHQRSRTPDPDAGDQAAASEDADGTDSDEAGVADLDPFAAGESEAGLHRSGTDAFDADRSPSEEESADDSLLDRVRESL